jgi:hypothetical protein
MKADDSRVAKSEKVSAFNQASIFYASGMQLGRRVSSIRKGISSSASCTDDSVKYTIKKSERCPAAELESRLQIGSAFNKLVKHMRIRSRPYSVLSPIRRVAPSINIP